MKKILVKLPSGYFDIEDIREEYEYFKDDTFEFMKWKPRTALIEKGGKQSWLFTGQKFDANYIELVENGWTHDHCSVCSITLTDFENEYQQTEGYFNGYDWICKGCYETLFTSNNLEETLSQLPKQEE